jgi:predicted alpha/beta superfamily hydrolase
VREREYKLTGEFHHHSNFRSRHLRTAHDLIVHLPPGYGNSNTRYPVLYLQDGQNLFDPATSFAGEPWAADETADALAREGLIKPLILVGVYNAGMHRINEYTPSRDSRMRRGGKGLLYGRMMAEEIKPFIDSEYRTMQGPEHTGLGGSSLGGLISLFVGLLYPHVFGKLAVLSPSVWWNGRAILHTVRTVKPATRPRIWLDIGTQEGDWPERMVQDVRSLRDALIEKGWRGGETLAYFEDEGGTHSEVAWRTRFGPMLRFLFPA